MEAKAEAENERKASSALKLEDHRKKTLEAATVWVQTANPPGLRHQQQVSHHFFQV